ncbi:hypothetical protein GQ44DRAFT_604559 [Phaeosphaeriaceae sp. PMI808]|nr:hypothetical protein GQ44DRAFT_604559 [Phaeosphaeriaceae sp. PMI808]
MGNNQSTSNLHNRLSKPKTNTNSPAQAFVADSPTSVSSRYGDLSAKGRHQIRETLLSPIDSEFGSTAWSNKGEDAIGELAPRARGRPLSVISRSNSRANSRTNSRTNSRSNSLSCFGSRHGSKISVVSNTQVDLDAAIRLLQEVKRNGSPEDLAALYEALETSADSPVPLADQQRPSRRISMADRSSSLTRRRSLLQTPGIATRNSPVEGRRRTWNSWKAPKMAPEQEAKWALSSKGITPVKRPMALDLAEETCSTSSLRAQTPGELDYSHLGSLKLGTLSIVNGAPSPAPSAKNTKHRSHYVGTEDYFTVTEAEPSPLSTKTKKQHGHVKSKSSVLPATTPFYENVSTSHAQPQTEHGNSIRTLNHKAIAYAETYQAHIPSSPFPNAKEANYETEAGSFSENAAPFREEGAKILAGTIFDAPSTAIEMSGSVLFSTASNVPSSEIDKVKSCQRPIPRTTDSGYSSGGSLRVSNRGRQSASPTSLPRNDRANEAQVVGVEILHVPQPGSSETKARPSRGLMPLHMPDLAERSSASDSTLSPLSTRSVVSKFSFNSTSSTTQKRLQRRRPGTPDVPIVQSYQSIPEGTIPDIPIDVRAKFTRRLSHTPGMECLTHTYPTKDHVTTADLPAGIESATSVQAITQLVELEPERPPTPPTPVRRRSRSLFRRKSVVENVKNEKENTNASPNIIDLGTIASSLGSSPYDAALSRPLPKTITSPIHPHQLDGVLPRVKSMTSMDSQAAAEFARMRSKDRALGDEEMLQQRRRSYHNLRKDAGEARKWRPQISVHDIPPVPSLQSAKPQLENETRHQISHHRVEPRAYPKRHIVFPRVDKYNQYGQSVVEHHVNWDAQAQHWSQRRKSIGEGLCANAKSQETRPATAHARNRSQPCEDMVVWDRYSGGLNYNYEGRRAGVGGSAGTRHQNSQASIKSMQWRNEYGVDLSDVPIMLQRA